MSTYDINKTSVNDLLSNDRMIRGIMSSHTLSEEAVKNRIVKHYAVAMTIQSGGPISTITIQRDTPTGAIKMDHGICSECGSSELMVTGSCAVCCQCGSSQGCS